MNNNRGCINCPNKSNCIVQIAHHIKIHRTTSAVNLKEILNMGKVDRHINKYSQLGEKLYWQEIKGALDCSLWGKGDRARRLETRKVGLVNLKKEGGWTRGSVGSKGTNSDLFRSSLVETEEGIGDQRVHPHWGSLHTGRN